jgi:hypothetical protein
MSEIQAGPEWARFLLEVHLEKFGFLSDRERIG